jgi:hypothetical protein
MEMIRESRQRTFDLFKPLVVPTTCRLHNSSTITTTTTQILLPPNNNNNNKNNNLAFCECSDTEPIQENIEEQRQQLVKQVKMILLNCQY